MRSGLILHLRKSLPKSLGRRLPQKIKLVKVSARESRKLNLIYRKKNQPANALSFFYDDSYGEILVCPEIIRKEAKKQGNSYQYQMTWMILHGMIHLAGVHHENSQKVARKMTGLEQKILEQLAGKNAKFKIQKSK